MATRQEKLESLAETATGEEILDLLWPVIDCAATASDPNNPTNGRLVDLNQVIQDLDAQLG